MVRQAAAHITPAPTGSEAPPQHPPTRPELTTTSSIRTSYDAGDGFPWYSCQPNFSLSNVGKAKSESWAPPWWVAWTVEVRLLDPVEDTRGPVVRGVEMEFHATPLVRDRRSRRLPRRPVAVKPRSEPTPQKLPLSVGARTGRPAGVRGWGSRRRRSARSSSEPSRGPWGTRPRAGAAGPVALPGGARSGKTTNARPLPSVRMRSSRPLPVALRATVRCRCGGVRRPAVAGGDRAEGEVVEVLPREGTLAKCRVVDGGCRGSGGYREQRGRRGCDGRQCCDRFPQVVHVPSV